MNAHRRCELRCFSLHSERLAGAAPRSDLKLCRDIRLQFENNDEARALSRFTEGTTRVSYRNISVARNADYSWS
jgi:hypothetical protein